MFKRFTQEKWNEDDGSCIATAELRSETIIKIAQNEIMLDADTVTDIVATGTSPLEPN